MENMMELLENIPDYRGDRGKLHNLDEIIVMSLYYLLYEMITWLDIQEICETREDELKNLRVLHKKCYHDILIFKEFINFLKFSSYLTRLNLFGY